MRSRLQIPKTSQATFAPLQRGLLQNRATECNAPGNPPPILHEALSLPVTAPPLIQPKLKIGAVGDKYEQEADRVASQVVEQINVTTYSQPSQEESVQGRETVIGGETSTNLGFAISLAKSGGQPLDASLQQLMGQSIRADFSGVRVHTDAQSDNLNRSLQAKAFTMGQDVFFRQGEYNPESRGGQKLIAHELTHVVQQKRGIQERSSVQQDEILQKERGFQIKPLIQERLSGNVIQCVKNREEYPWKGVIVVPVQLNDIKLPIGTIVEVVSSESNTTYKVKIEDSKEILINKESVDDPVAWKISEYVKYEGKQGKDGGQIEWDTSNDLKARATKRMESSLEYQQNIKKEQEIAKEKAQKKKEENALKVDYQQNKLNENQVNELVESRLPAFLNKQFGIDCSVKVKSIEGGPDSWKLNVEIFWQGRKSMNSMEKVYQAENQTGKKQLVITEFSEDEEENISKAELNESELSNQPLSDESSNLPKDTDDIKLLCYAIIEYAALKTGMINYDDYVKQAGNTRYNLLANIDGKKLNGKEVVEKPPELTRGDIVILGGDLHWAIATGQKDNIYSLWNRDKQKKLIGDRDRFIPEETSLREMVEYMAKNISLESLQVEIGTPKWHRIKS